MSTNLILVRAQWDAEAAVWVATSEDVPGLATEADTLEALRDKVLVMIPELLEANGMASDQPELRLHILAEWATRIPNPRAAAEWQAMTRRCCGY